MENFARVIKCHIIDFTFHYGPLYGYGSPYDYVIHIGLITTSRASLISSFQPPLIAKSVVCTDILCSCV